jgi:hypothetical protein
MATSAERMRAHRERARRRLRRLTVDVSEDDLRSLAEQGYEDAASTDQDCRSQAISRFISDTVASDPQGQLRASRGMRSPGGIGQPTRAPRRPRCGTTLGPNSDAATTFAVALQRRVTVQQSGSHADVTAHRALQHRFSRCGRDRRLYR